MHLIRTTRRRVRPLAACLPAAAVVVPATAVSMTTASAASSLPCDVCAAGGTPCETAHSTRALFAAYNGPLYQIQRASDHGYLDISVLSAGGCANAAPQQWTLG